MRGSRCLATVLLAALTITSVSAETVSLRNSDSVTECPSDPWPAAILIPHEYDCTRYYVCFGGRKILSECGLKDSAGNRLYFDSVVQGCVWPEDSSCVSTTEISISESSSTENGGNSNDSSSSGETDAGSSEDSDSSAEETQPIIPTECPPDNEGDATHIAHESDCGLFYKCNHGQKVEIKCADGLAFNPALQVCDWPANVGCTPGSSDAPDSSSSAETDGPTTENVITDEQTTSSEIESSSTENGGDSNDSSTPGETDAGSSEGSGSSAEETQPTIPTECPPNNDGAATHIAHESDCGLFYKCNHGEKVEMKCADGLAFNPALQVCDWPANVGCIPGSSDAPDSSSSTETDGPTTENVITDEQTTSSEIESSSTENGGDGNDSSTPGETDAGSSEGSGSSAEETQPTIPTECPPNNDGAATHIAHESDCGLFYKCNHGEKVEMKCADGLAFNPALQVCDWPANVGCIPGSSDAPDSSSSTETDGPTTENVITDEQTTSSEIESSSTENGGDSNDSSTPGETDAGSSEGSGSSAEETQPTIPTECPPNNDGDATHIAHESDCGLFYKCNHGQKVEMKCADGLAFNPALQVCDWPANVGCIPGSSDAPDSSSSAETDGPTTENVITDEQTTSSEIESSSTENGGDSNDSSTPGETDAGSSEGSGSSAEETQPTIPTECPPNNDGDATHIAHESDCGLFYKCNHGQKVEMKCADGLAFNPAFQVCDWPVNVGCTPGSSDAPDSSSSAETDGPTTDNVITDEQTTSSEIESSSTENGGDSNDSSTPGETDAGSSEGSGSSAEETQPTIPTECPPNNDGNATHIAHESDCGLFYKCNHGQKVEMKCADGLAFNPAFQVCDWPVNVGCTPGSSDAPDSSSPAETDGPTTENDITDEQTTSSEIESSSTENGGNSNDSSNPGEAEGSDLTTTETQPIIPTECPSNNEGYATHIVHESDCGLFYTCHNGQKVEMACPSGLQFNAALQLCDWAENAGCQVGSGDSEAP